MWRVTSQGFGVLGVHGAAIIIKGVTGILNREQADCFDFAQTVAALAFVSSFAAFCQGNCDGSQAADRGQRHMHVTLHRETFDSR